MGISRQRPVPPEDFTFQEFFSLPAAVRTTMTGLRMHADDQGRENANERLLWSSIWPLSTEVHEDDLLDHLLILAELDWLILYSAGGRTYFQIVHWPKVDRPNPSRLPAPPSRTARDSFAAVEGESARASESAEGGPSRMIPGLGPSPFCIEHPNGINEPCRDCGTARLRHERWARAQVLGAQEADS